MKQSIDYRVLATAVRAKAGQPETDTEIAAPVVTDPKKHRVLQSGSTKNADGSRVLSVAWRGDSPDTNGKVRGGEKSRLRAAHIMPNKKRLALCVQAPYRLNLTRRRKTPVAIWGAFSPPV